MVGHAFLLWKYANIYFVCYPIAYNLIAAVYLGKKFNTRLKQFIMKHLFFIFLLEFVSPAFLFPQTGDIYQPSQVYKQNNVKTRVLMHNYNKNFDKTIEFFNRNGYLTAKIEFDSTGKNYLLKIMFDLDSSGKLISQRLFYYSRFDTVTKKKIVLPSFDSTLTLFGKTAYDTAGRLKNISFTNPTRKLAILVSLNYDPLVKIEKTFSLKDSGYSLKTVYYDKPYVENNIQFESHWLTGDNYKWEERMKNLYDKSGKIIGRKTRIESYKNGVPDYPFYFKEASYKYAPYGLLISKTYSEPTDYSDKLSAAIFDYRFWD